LKNGNWDTAEDGEKKFKMFVREIGYEDIMLMQIVQDHVQMFLLAVLKCWVQ
jgi:hypothetical protein